VFSLGGMGMQIRIADFQVIRVSGPHFNSWMHAANFARDTAFVHIPDPVLASIAALEDPASTLSIQISNYSRNGVQFLWGLGDENSSTTSQPMHTYSRGAPTSFICGPRIDSVARTVPGKRSRFDRNTAFLCRPRSYPTAIGSTTCSSYKGRAFDPLFSGCSTGGASKFSDRAASPIPGMDLSMERLYLREYITSRSNWSWRMEGRILSRVPSIYIA
jgi:hypothetical protein